MRTSGHGNDTPLILIPIGVSVIVGVILLGGPTNALGAVNGVVRDVTNHVLAMLSAWF